MTTNSSRIPVIETSMQTDWTEYYRYVLHGHRVVYEDLGWVVAATLPFPHGYWSVLMMWAGDGSPQEPIK